MHSNQTHNGGSVWRHHFPRHHLLAACGISLALVITLSILPDSVIANRSSVMVPDSIPVAPSNLAATSLPHAAPIHDPWLHLTINKGDTLSSLLQDSGLSINDVHSIANNTEQSKELAALKLGD